MIDQYDPVIAGMLVESSLEATGEIKPRVQILCLTCNKPLVRNVRCHGSYLGDLQGKTILDDFPVNWIGSSVGEKSRPARSSERTAV